MGSLETLGTAFAKKAHTELVELCYLSDWTLKIIQAEIKATGVDFVVQQRNLDRLTIVFGLIFALLTVVLAFAVNA